MSFFFSTAAPRGHSVSEGTRVSFMTICLNALSSRVPDRSRIAQSRRDRRMTVSENTNGEWFICDHGGSIIKVENIVTKVGQEVCKILQ